MGDAHKAMATALHMRDAFLWPCAMPRKPLLALIVACLVLGMRALAMLAMP